MFYVAGNPFRSYMISIVTQRGVSCHIKIRFRIKLFWENPCILSYVCLIIDITLTDFYSVRGEVSLKTSPSLRFFPVVGNNPVTIVGWLDPEVLYLFPSRFPCIQSEKTV